MFGGRSAIIESYLGWWADAGRADALCDSPRPWFTGDTPRSSPTAAETAPPRTGTLHVAPAPTPATATPSAAPATDLPAMLDGFERWLMESPDLPGAHWSRLRVPPTGPADAPLMILSDVPDADDVADGRLFAGQHGKLLDAMLAAIKLSRDTIRIASLAPTAPAGGRIPASEFSALAAIARHHVALARPCTLLLMGRQSCAIMTGDVVNPRFGQHFLNQIGVTSAVYSMHHPRLLLKQPLLKRQSWDVLKQIRSRN